MTRISLGALLFFSLAANAQNAPATTAVHAVSPTAAVSTPTPAQAAPAAGGSNPFAPHLDAPAPTSVANPLQQAPVELTEDVVKAAVETAFRAQNTRVGRVNGQTIFKLEADKKFTYLFVPTGLQDAQPLVPSAKPMTSGNSGALPPHIPMSAPSNAPPKN